MYLLWRLSNEWENGDFLISTNVIGLPTEIKLPLKRALIILYLLDCIIWTNKLDLQG